VVVQVVGRQAEGVNAVANLTQAGVDAFGEDAVDLLLAVRLGQ
jgi:hypothetical protein